MEKTNNYYRKGGHTTYDCRYHVVFLPKYRYDVLRDDKIRDFIATVFDQVCEWKEIVLIEGKLRPDHVHLYISVPPKYAVSDAVKWLKEKSVTRVFREFPTLLNRYWGGHFWARGYFVSTVGITDEIIKAYIQNQEQKELEKEEQTKQLRLWK